MKNKQDILDEIASREAREEVKNPVMHRSPFRERVDGIVTTDKKWLEKLFRIKLIQSPWETESFQNVAEAKASVISAVKRQMLVRRAKKKAAEIGLHYWPALMPNGMKDNVDPLAYVAAEKVVLTYGKKPWGTKLEKIENMIPYPVRKNRIHHGGWDSCGHWGVSPQQVAVCWFASGCKDTPKFRYLVRHTRGEQEVSFSGHKLKGLSLRQLTDLRRGQRWLQNHRYSTHSFSNKAVIALGRISPAARKAAMEEVSTNIDVGEHIEGLTFRINGIVRIRDLNWGAVKALQTMSKQEITARYLAGRYAWDYLHGVSTPKGLEKVSPVGWSKDRSGVWSSRTVTFRDFSIWAPAGYAFGVDENGIKLFVVRSPEDDYHFTEEEVKGDVSGWGRSLFQKLQDNLESRRAQRATEREAQLMMDNLHLIMVSRHDSYRAGNCAAGTQSFAERNGLDQRRGVNASVLYRLAKGGYDKERVMNTIRVAWERETLVMI